jgi:hypothetical protein
MTAMGAGFFLNYFQGRSLRWINVIAGLILMMVGAMIFTNSLAMMTGYLTEIGIGWLVGQ